MHKIYEEVPNTEMETKAKPSHPHRHNPERKRPLWPVETPEQPMQPPVSVPFHWEEVPGKTKPCYSEDIALPKSLDPPPRLWNCGGHSMFSNTPSPKTVLDGPYMGSGTRSIRTFSFRKMLFFNGGSFRSSRGSTPEKQQHSGKDNEKEVDVVGGSMRWGILQERGDVVDDNNDENKFSDTFHREFAAETRKKFLWETLYESFKQVVVPWRRTD